MAGKKKMAPTGWANHNGGEIPFTGAADPIHVQAGGKYYKGKNKPHPDQKKYDGGCSQ
jgi:hypothetical protein